MEPPFVQKISSLTLTKVSPFKGEVITALDGNAPTVALVEAGLRSLPDAVAFAVITSLAVSVSPVFVHVPPVTVVVPSEVVPFLNNSIVVPSLSVLVPLMDVVLGQMGLEVITGVAVMVCLEPTAKKPTVWPADEVTVPDATV